MKILFVVPYVPNLVRTRPYNLIRHLAERGHHITLATLCTNPDDQRDFDHLKDNGLEAYAQAMPRWRSLVNCLVALPTRSPLQAVYSWQPRLAEQLSVLVSGANGRPFDLVHVEHMRGVRYGLHLKAHFPTIPVVWDSVDCISHLFEQAAGQSRSLTGKAVTRFELKRTRAYEGRLPSRVDRVLITSPMDRDALLALVPEATHHTPISVLPNGVDWEYFGETSSDDRYPETVLLSGKMSYHANVTMAHYLFHEVMPLVWKKHPQMKLVIAGKDPVAEVRAMAAHPAVTVTGTVSDLRPYLQQATMAVVPMLYGAGIQNKVLEAMACGTPVVASQQAVSALETDSGKEILVADGAEDFAAKMVNLVTDRSYQRQIGEAGKAYVQRHHDWGAIAGQLEAIYQDVVNGSIGG